MRMRRQALIAHLRAIPRHTVLPRLAVHCCLQDLCSDFRDCGLPSGLSLEQRPPLCIGHLGDFTIGHMASLSLGQVTSGPACNAASACPAMTVDMGQIPLPPVSGGHRQLWDLSGYPL